MSFTEIKWHKTVEGVAVLAALAWGNEWKQIIEANKTIWHTWIWLERYCWWDLIMRGCILLVAKIFCCLGCQHRPNVLLILSLQYSIELMASHNRHSVSLSFLDETRTTTYYNVQLTAGYEALNQRPDIFAYSSLFLCMREEVVRRHLKVHMNLSQSKQIQRKPHFL